VSFEGPITAVSVAKRQQLLLRGRGVSGREMRMIFCRVARRGAALWLVGWLAAGSGRHAIDQPTERRTAAKIDDKDDWRNDNRFAPISIASQA